MKRKLSLLLCAALTLSLLAGCGPKNTGNGSASGSDSTSQSTSQNTEDRTQVDFMVLSGPTGVGAAGYTMPLPEKDEMFNTKNKMLETIMVSLGGRIAEEIIFGDVTTGASQDIKQASAIARAMVTQYGMSEKLGMINYGSDDDEVFIGRDLAHTRSYGERVASDIDSEVKRIIDECYAKAKEIILAHEDILHKCAALLIEKEKIGQEEFDSLFAEGTEKPELE